MGQYVKEAAYSRTVLLWLTTCCGMIFVMALLGAITRLTESGLSITNWEPVKGILPPLNEAAWNKAFDAYKAIPQYQIFNRGMSLEEFQNIYFWEWFHRLWGRLIGFVLAVPLMGFFLARKIPRALFLKLCLIFALGGLQGFIGWFMVQSGLETRTEVSPYRLALHLGFALLLYGLLVWTVLSYSKSGAMSLPLAGGARGGLDSTSTHTDSLSKTASAPPLSPPQGGGRPPASVSAHGWIALCFLITTIIWGAFVAGLRAGGAYNTWPLMDGSFMPKAALSLQPIWLNGFENTALVQFIHRWLGPTTLLLILSWIARCWRYATGQQKRMLAALGLMACVQVGLGISTLLSHVQIALAVTHQAGAIVLLTLLLINLHGFASTTTQSK